MAVQVEGNKRSISVSVDLDVSVERAWAAIATGPGISSWFAPTTVDERAGGELRCQHAPGMESVAEVTSWEPPHALAAHTPEWMPGSPDLDTLWQVEETTSGARVTVTHTMETEADTWDPIFGDVEKGWGGFFRILQIYLAEFEGQSCTIHRCMAMGELPVDECWSRLVEAGGLGEAGQAWSGLEGWSGGVHSFDGDGKVALVRLADPIGGVAWFSAFPMGPSNCISVGLYLYGEGADAVDPGPWQQWLEGLLT